MTGIPNRAEEYSSSLEERARARFGLSDVEWLVIQPMLPDKVPGVPPGGRPPLAERHFWRLRTGAPWADIPERYGPHMTCYNRLVRWRT